MELYKQISANKRRSIFLVVIVVGLLIALGYAVGIGFGYGYWPLLLAFVLSIGLSVGSYWFSDKLTLSMTRAREVGLDEAPQLHNIVEGLCIASGMPKPRIFVVQDSSPNAFATGRNPTHGVIAVTTGLLALMSRDELEGVLAHELCHIRNYDILLQSMVVVLVGAIVLLSDIFLRSMWWGGGRNRGDGDNSAGGILAIVGIALMLLAPIAARLISLSVSRKREALADVTAVELTRYPAGLRRALEKLAADGTVVRAASRATAHMWIESPLDTEQGHREARVNRMFATHPPIADRIATLRRIEGGAVDPGPTGPPLAAPNPRGAVEPGPPPPQPPLPPGAVGPGQPGGSGGDRPRPSPPPIGWIPPGGFGDDR